jgi:hypothetical protein
MKIQQILSSVNEGVLDDVRARMAAGRDPAAAQPTAAPVANAGRFKVGDTVDFGVGVPKPKVIQQGTVTAIQGTGYTVKTADGQTHELDSRMISLYLVPAASDTQDVAEAYDPAAAAKIIGVATKAGIRIFYDKFTSDSNFRNEIDAEYGFKYKDIKITSIPTAIGFAKSAMAWLNARGAYLTYNPKAPVQFQLTMPNQAEPYDFNVMDVMERWKPYGANESAPAGGNKVTKFDPVTGLLASGQISEFEGDVVNYPPTTGTPTQSTPTTQQPPRRGYSIHLIKKPGGNGANYEAKDAWLALSAVFPKDYPLAGPNNDGPAQHKVYEVVKNGSAVVKSGIGSEDIAETLVAKLVKFRVPYDCWEITSEDLNESVSNQLQSLLKSAGIVQNK